LNFLLLIFCSRRKNKDFNFFNSFGFLACLKYENIWKYDGLNNNLIIRFYTFFLNFFKRFDFKKNFFFNTFVAKNKFNHRTITKKRKNNAIEKCKLNFIRCGRCLKGHILSQKNIYNILISSILTTSDFFDKIKLL